MNLKFIISDQDSDVVEQLRLGIRSEGIEIVNLKPDQVLSLDGLDAIYLSTMGAERWGARPVTNKAQILSTTADDQSRGYPPYIIAGGVFDLSKSNDPTFQLEVIVASIIEAVKDFNVSSPKIRTVAIWAQDLLVQDIGALKTGKLIQSVYDNYVI